MAKCTEYYDLPLGKICTAEELERYFNSLLCKVDNKLHEVQMLCANPNSGQLECIVKELTDLRCKLIAVENIQGKQNIQLKCSLDRGNANQLEILKLNDKLEVAVGDIEDAVYRVNEALAKVELIATEFDEVKEKTESFDGRISSNTENINNLTQELNNTNEAVSRLNLDLDTHINNSDNNFNNLESQYQGINSRVSDLELGIDTLESINDSLTLDISNINSRLIVLGNSLSSLETLANNHTGKITGLEETYGELSAKYIGIRKELDELIASSDNPDITDLTNKVIELENTTNELKDNVELNTQLINSHYEDYQITIQGVQNSIDNLNTEKDNTNESITNLNNRVNNIVGDLPKIEYVTLHIDINYTATFPDGTTTLGNGPLRFAGILINQSVLLVHSATSTSVEIGTTNGPTKNAISLGTSVRITSGNKHYDATLYFSEKMVIPGFNPVSHNPDGLQIFISSVTAKTLNKEIDIFVKSNMTDNSAIKDHSAYVNFILFCRVDSITEV